MTVPAIAVKNISKIFGSVRALDQVSIDIHENTFHALMGENGAGKSTIAKCIMGFYTAEEGKIMLHGKEIKIDNPREAHKHGIGMVYQHFMLIDNMTVAENLIIARESIPALIHWKKEKKDLEAFMHSMPFQLNLKTLVRNLSAGEKQKLEILKMLYLDCKILLLDEPTSVLTPQEADEVLSFLKSAVLNKKLTVIIITHKFREVFGYADEVSVLRKGKFAGGGRTEDFTKSSLAELMIGTKMTDRDLLRTPFENMAVKLSLQHLYDQENGVPVLDNFNLSIKQGEIYGVAGVSGNGQKRLVELLGGQKDLQKGQIKIGEHAYLPTRKSMKEFHFHCLPEEPLKNACVGDMSVADNMALHYYDCAPYQKNGMVKTQQIVGKARDLIARFNVKTPSPSISIKSLSGGNVQRAVLARELTDDVAVLVVSNPCFGLDFNAIADIRSLIVKARNKGTAVLLLSEDLDEIMELSDRIGVISNGSIVYEVEAAYADSKILGEKMAGH